MVVDPLEGWDLEKGDRVQVKQDPSSLNSSDPGVQEDNLARLLETGAPETLKHHPNAARSVDVLVLDGAKRGNSTFVPRFLLRPLAAP